MIKKYEILLLSILLILIILALSILILDYYKFGDNAKCFSYFCYQ